MVLSKSSKQNVKEKQMKLQFNKEKQNTQGVQFRIDPITNQNLTALRNYYSEQAGRRVTTGEICKQLINLHAEELNNE
tara:strand:- start:44 stop:277 length:234 start_codon:yes stop_codon:yes gene_type:complete